MQSDRALREFVRSTLGCTCPEAVFEHVERSQRQQLTREHPYSLRLVIGNRLLIYALEYAQLATAQLQLEDLLTAGRRDRDVQGYNRFRAVLSGVTGTATKASLEAEWRQLVADDEPAHLHLVAPEDLLRIAAQA